MFHPSMLANQPDLRAAGKPIGLPVEAVAYQQWKAGFTREQVEANTLRPNGLTWHDLYGWMARQGLGEIPTAPAQAPLFDTASGTLNIGGNQIKLVPAILSALAVKLVFFSGKQVAKGAKRVAGKLSGKSPLELAANPDAKRQSEKPWECVLFDAGWNRKGRKRFRTRTAAATFAAQNPGMNHRISYIG